MINRGGGNQLADQHKKHRVSDAEMGCNMGDGQHVKGNQRACEEQMQSRLSVRLGRSVQTRFLSTEAEHRFLVQWI